MIKYKQTCSPSPSPKVVKPDLQINKSNISALSFQYTIMMYPKSAK